MSNEVKDMIVETMNDIIGHWIDNIYDTPTSELIDDLKHLKGDNNKSYLLGVLNMMSGLIENDVVRMTYDDTCIHGYDGYEVNIDGTKEECPDCRRIDDVVNDELIQLG
jgi:hypothetical protein